MTIPPLPRSRGLRVNEGTSYMTNCHLPGPAPSPYGSWSEWFEAEGSKGVIHGIRMESLPLRSSAQQEIADAEAFGLTSTSGSLVEPSDIFPTEYADSDGDGIRIMMEPADETGRVCWVVRNSRHVNPCHEFPTPEAAYAAHKSASAHQAVAAPAPASSLVERLEAAGYGRTHARAAIREVGGWLEGQRGADACYYGGLLREEADR